MGICSAQLDKPAVAPFFQVHLPFPGKFVAGNGFLRGEYGFLFSVHVGREKRNPYFLATPQVSHAFPEMGKDPFFQRAAGPGQGNGVTMAASQTSGSDSGSTEVGNVGSNRGNENA